MFFSELEIATLKNALAARRESLRTHRDFAGYTFTPSHQLELEKVEELLARLISQTEIAETS